VKSAPVLAGSAEAALAPEPLGQMLHIGGDVKWGDCFQIKPALFGPIQELADGAGVSGTGVGVADAPAARRPLDGHAAGP
jgi:hypothetical protein